jgi:O-antigen/teichoic acid export membrane protein
MRSLPTAPTATAMPPGDAAGCGTLEAGDALAPSVPWTAPATREKAGGFGFARHVVMFSAASLVALVCNGCLTFLVPRWLSMESYGSFRLFVLYGGFAGVLHFGLLDGALIRWAARPRRRLKAEVRRSLIFLLFQHAALLIPAMTILLIRFRHHPWFFLAEATLLYAWVWNAVILGQFALQAEKSFGLLSAVTVIHPVLLLAAVAAFNYFRYVSLGAVLGAYLAAWLAAGVVVWIALLGKHPGTVRAAGQVWHTGVHNIRMGAGVLLAGLVTNLALSLDRFAVSLSFSLRDFAIYSLGATALAVVNTIILSVSRVVFPYLSDGLDAGGRVRAYAQGEAALMAMWALSLAGYFPMQLLIERLLPAYQPSLPILRVLMLSTGMTAAIYILHANYFRSSLRLSALLFGAGVGLAAAALLLALARHSGKLANMSWAMVGAVALWWTADEVLLRRQLSRTPIDIARTLAFASACGGWFLLCAAFSASWLGALPYGALAVLLTVAAYGQTLRPLPGWSLRLLAFR